jgi:beta-galactosidase
MSKHARLFRYSILALAVLRAGGFAAPAAPGSSPAAGREAVLLDAGWRFALGHASDRSRDWGFGGDMEYSKIKSWNGPARPDFKDAAWRLLDLPHDWVVELPFVDKPASDELESHGFKPVGQAFPASSVGWYRRHLALPAADAGRRLALEFDGAFRDCLVWVNGILVGRHEGGYAPFGFDVTDVMECGQDNVIAVRVDATSAEGWFYEGAGIYRHVRLIKTAPVHVPKGGIAVAPALAGSGADVAIRTSLANDANQPANAALESRIVDPAGKTVATFTDASVAVAPWATVEVRQAMRLSDAVLWSLEAPKLYRLVTTIRVGGAAVDELTTRFGVRDIRFDPDRGFFLNGKRVQLNGVCCHQDHAGVGAAVPDSVQRWRIARLKEMGVNAYRTSHNPPAPEILEACDELGMLVMDETRLFSSSAMSLEQLAAMVRRDRNHPSVILWSIGNEEEDVQGVPLGRRVAETMARTVRALDATRPVTYASNSGYYEGANEVMDVRGFNYHLDAIDAYHKAHPRLPLFGSEIASTLTTRGEYARDDARTYLPAYDKNKPAWGELAEEWWTFYAARPWLAGAFIWTGFDYRGEPTPFDWPCISSHFGILDTCGFAKDLFWYYKSWWTSDPVLHLLPHWNWKGKEGQEIEVWAFTNCDEVALALNGKALGARKVAPNGHAAWRVPYAPGRLEAVGFKGGKEILRDAVETTGPAARIVLAADRPGIGADGRDVGLVTVSAVDAAGRPVPTADADIAFDVKGPGRIIGVGNGNPSSHEPDTFPEGSAARRRLFNGLAQVLVRSAGGAGEIVLTAKAAGLAPAALALRADNK